MQDDDSGFLGTGWAFPPAFDAPSRDAALVSGADDIAESLLILLSTRPGERVMRPTYGCDLRSIVFEHIDLNTATRIRTMIEQAVRFFEPRVTLEDVRLKLDRLPTAAVLRIELVYLVRGTNSRHNLVYPLYIEEGNAVGRVL